MFAGTKDNHNMLQGFPSISRPDINILILGSMPGNDSLAAGKYYAHQRNAFWPIMTEIYGGSSDISYDDRLEMLLDNRVGLWDVIKNCERESSLDSRIEESTIVVNDLLGFIDNHPQLRLLCFNGIKAEQTFNRYIDIKDRVNDLQLLRLPSTSPANARMNFEEKLAIWRSALKG